MSDQRNNAANRRKQQPDGFRKVDHRYRESKYFLLDQLKYADSVQEFRSVKQAILGSTQFSIAKRAFHYIRVTVPTDHR